MGDRKLVLAIQMQVAQAVKEMEGLRSQFKKFSGDSGQLKKEVLGSQIQFALLQQAVRGATNFLKECITAFIEQEKVEAQLNATLKSTGYAAGITAGELKKMAAGMQSVTTFGDEAVIGAESLLLTFTKIGKDIFPQALETVLDMSTALGQDLKSSAIQLGKALQDPILGVTALRRVGVNFNEEQTEVIKNLVKTGQSAKAQAMILAELNTEFGGSARAARDTFGGALKALQNDFGDMQEVIGAAIVPALGDLVKMIMPVVNAIKNMDEGTIKIILGFGAAIVVIFAVVKAVNALKAAFVAGFGPLTIILGALAVLGGVVAAINQTCEDARVVHQKLAEQYIAEYKAIDGQVSRYEELKNKTKLNTKEKSELSGIETSLKRKLGETSLAIEEQSGKWKVNATAASQYKKERLELTIKELQAQEVVAQNDVKWAKERSDAWERIKTGQLSALEAGALAIKYQFAFKSGAEVELQVLEELGKTQDKLTNTQGQLNALTKDGVQRWTDYTSAQDNATEGVKRFLTETEKLAEAEKIAQEYRTKLFEMQASEIEKLDKEKMEALEKAYGYAEAEAAIYAYYAVKRTELEKTEAEKRAEAEKKAFDDTISMIDSTIGEIGNLFSSLENIFSQYYQNQLDSLDSEYAKRKKYIEENVSDEKERTKQLEALEEEKAAKEREIKRNQFIADKAFAVIESIMATALAVTKVLYNIPLAIAVGILGAIQTAMIAAQPMPSFAEGGSFQTTGPMTMRVGDNSGGVEQVTVTPVSSRGANANDIYIEQPCIIVIDATPVYRGLLRASKSGIALLDARAVLR